MDDNVLLFSRGRNNFRVRRGWVPILQAWPSTKKSDGTETLTTTDSVNGGSVLLETQFVRTHLRVYTTWVLFVVGSLPLMGAAGEARVRHQTAIRDSTHDFFPRLSPEVFSTRGYFRKAVTV